MSIILHDIYPNYYCTITIVYNLVCCINVKAMLFISFTMCTTQTACMCVMEFLKNQSHVSCAIDFLIGFDFCQRYSSVLA